LNRPLFEVADIARQYRGELAEKGKLNVHQKKVLTAICNCRTAELGGHRERCSDPTCPHERFAYNGCRDRHCPKCNGMKREKWVADRKADALPVPYFHIVFTLPYMLEGLCLRQGKGLYNLLFASAWGTISQLALDHKHLGAGPGAIILLHTWGQNLMRHTHLHCLVPAGGIDRQGKWRGCKQEGKFFVHVKQLSKVFRGKFTDGLIRMQEKGLVELPGGIMDKGKKYLHPLYKTQWVVYAKSPLPTSDNVVEYIGRYSHGVAIGNHRIKSFENGSVGFSWLDYRTSRTAVMTIGAGDFLQRFATHILPEGFVKIRHYGILSPRNKVACLKAVREQLGVAPVQRPPKGRNWMETFELLYGRHPKLCPCCGKGLMLVVETIEPRYRIRQRDGPQTDGNPVAGSPKE
jgi:hypothetical protein